MASLLHVGEESADSLVDGGHGGVAHAQEAGGELGVPARHVVRPLCSSNSVGLGPFGSNLGAPSLNRGSADFTGAGSIFAFLRLKFLDTLF